MLHLSSSVNSFGFPHSEMAPVGKNPPGQYSKDKVQALDQLCVGGYFPGAADIWMYALIAKTDDNGCSHASAG